MKCLCGTGKVGVVYCIIVYCIVLHWWRSGHKCYTALSMYRVFGLNLTVDVFFVKSNISRRKKQIFSKIKRC